MTQVRNHFGLSFDDVLLSPRLNTIDSRDKVDTSTELGTLQLDIPIIAANMPTVCEHEMATAMSLLGGLGIIHRMQSIQEQAYDIKTAFDGVHFYGSDEDVPVIGAAVGIGEDAMERAEACLAAGASVICIDVAHGHDPRLATLIPKLFSICEGLNVIAGNIATVDAAKYLLDSAGPDRDRLTLKVGVGGGSVCTTRIQTGCGVPTFQSVLDASPQGTVIADGGIKTSGDVVKSLAAGASAVMLGSLLAGTEEAPGDSRHTAHGLVKPYRGAASVTSKRLYFGKEEYVEGEETVIPFKGSVHTVVEKLMEGVRSGFTYCGAENLEDLWANAEFVRITPAGFAESKPHLLGR